MRPLLLLTSLAAAKESAEQRLQEAKQVAEQQAAIVKEKAKLLEQELIFPGEELGAPPRPSAAAVAAAPAVAELGDDTRASLATAEAELEALRRASAQAQEQPSAAAAEARARARALQDELAAKAGARRKIVDRARELLRKASADPRMAGAATDSAVDAVQARPWVLWLLARLRFVSSFQELMATRTYAFSNARLKAEFGVTPRPLDDSIRDTLTSIVAGGWATPKPSKRPPAAPDPLV